MEQGDRVRVLIAGTSTSIRRGLQGLVASIAHFDALSELAVESADVCLTAELEQIPIFGDRVPVVVVVDDLSPHVYRQAFSAGASAVVHSDQPDVTIGRVVESATHAEVVIPYAVLADFLRVDGAARLTPPETDLLQALSSGETLTSYTSRAYLSERTARRLLQSACIKLGASGRGEAIKLASKSGLIS